MLRQGISRNRCEFSNSFAAILWITNDHGLKVIGNTHGKFRFLLLAYLYGVTISTRSTGGLNSAPHVFQAARLILCETSLILALFKLLEFSRAM